MNAILYESANVKEVLKKLCLLEGAFLKSHKTIILANIYIIQLMLSKCSIPKS